MVSELLIFWSNPFTCVVLYADDQAHQTEKKKKENNFNQLTIVNTHMGQPLPSEKLDRNNFASWEYKMHQYLDGQSNWSYIEGAQESKPNPTHGDYPTCEQAASRVLYYSASCVHYHMLGYIQEAKTSKEALENLEKIFAANTTAGKLQLRQVYWTTSNRGICLSQAIPWKSRSCATHSAWSMLILTTMRWCKYAWWPSTMFRRNKMVFLTRKNLPFFNF